MADTPEEVEEEAWDLLCRPDAPAVWNKDCRTAIEAALREAEKRGEARGFAKGLEDFAVLAMKRADHYEVKHEDAKDAKDAAALAMAAAAITWHAAADTARSLAAQSPPDPSAPPEVAAAEPKP